MVSAFRISRTSPSRSSDHLSPFALCTALACSLDGRDSIDYYEDSVAIGLAPRRRSRVPSGAERIERDGGAPLIPLNWFATNRPPSGGNGPRKTYGSFSVARPKDAVAVSVRFHRWGLGCKQFSFHHIARASRDGTVSVFGCLPLFQHALVP
jgi:hypothetical protein